MSTICTCRNLHAPSMVLNTSVSFIERASGTLAKMRLIAVILALSVGLSSLAIAFAYNDTALACCGRVSSAAYVPGNVSRGDIDLLNVALNLEYLEAEFFGHGALGYGIDEYEPSLAGGGPPPKGIQKASLDPLVRDIITQFALQEFGHIKAIRSTLGDDSIPRPQLDLSKQAFAATMDKAFGKKLVPSFDCYANSLNYMLAVYIIPYVGLTGYVGANPNLETTVARRLVGGLLGVESGQDAVTRTYLYQKKEERVGKYDYTVAEFTEKISSLRRNLDSAGCDDEGIVVPKCLGAEGKSGGNILSGDELSLSFARTPKQVFEVVYGTGDASKPGGFYPRGANGRVAQKFLR